MAEVEITYKGSAIATMNTSGTKTLETAGKYCEGDIEVEYIRPSAALQSKTVSPSLSQQTISPDSGYDGLSSVTVNAMPSGTAGTPTAEKDLVAAGTMAVTPTVTNTTGYIIGGTISGSAITVTASEVTSGTKTITMAGSSIDVAKYKYASVASGTEGTPTASKGTVSNNSVSITPSVTNTGGLISGGTHTGTAVTVSASELVSGTKVISTSGTIDVTNYANVSVSNGEIGINDINININSLDSSNMSINSSGLVTFTGAYNGNISVDEVIDGWVSSASQIAGGSINIDLSKTYQLQTQAAQTITPTTTDQTIASGKYLTGTQTIKGDANLLASNIVSGVSIFGVVGTASGGGGMTVVETSDSHGGTIVTITGEVITLQDKSVMPSTLSQIISADSGYTGLNQVNVAGDANLLASNIASGVSIFGVVGTHSGGIIPTGTFSVSAAGTFDVTSYASISVPAGSVVLPDLYYTESNGLSVTTSVNSSGLVTTEIDLDTNYDATFEANFHEGYVNEYSGNAAIQVAANHTYQLPSQAAQTITPTTTNQTIASQTYLTGTQTILGDANLVPSNIASGVSIFGVTGTLSGGGGAGWETAPESYVDALINKTITEASGSMVLNIRSYAFYSCSSLTSVSFPNCQLIGSYAFYSCINLTEANFPQCSTMLSYAFNYCSNLISISFPNCISVGFQAFTRCTKLTIASFSKCLQISGYAFQSCSSLSLASFPNCLYVAQSAFYACTNLTSIYFPNCVSLGGCFSGCTGLTEAIFPKCSYISGSTFYDCINLTVASFPVCRTIGSSAFYNCSKLESVYILAKSIPVLSLNAFANTPMTKSTYLGHFGSIYVLSDLLNNYKVATNWSAFSSRFVGV